MLESYGTNTGSDFFIWGVGWGVLKTVFYAIAKTTDVEKVSIDNNLRHR